MIIDEKGPNHIGIILDGNRRWAKERNLATLNGHKAGAEAVKKIVIHAHKIGLKYLTLYAFSTENWKRDPIEVTGLMKLLDKFVKELIESKDKRKIRIKIYGDISVLDLKLQENIIKLEEKTKLNDELTLGICLNYGGRIEILKAIKEIASNVKSGEINLDEISEEMVSNSLYTSGIPDPDLIIRTGNECRLSNFLIWQLAYSELYFPENLLWPDFDERQLEEAIEEYIKRKRRFGGN